MVTSVALALLLSGCTTRYFFPGPGTEPEDLSPGTWASPSDWGFSLTLRDDGTGEVKQLPVESDPSDSAFAPCVFSNELKSPDRVHRVDAPVTWTIGDKPSDLNVRVKAADGDFWLWITADGFSAEHWGRLWYFPCDPDNELIPLDKLD